MYSLFSSKETSSAMKLYVLVAVVMMVFALLIGGCAPTYRSVCWPQAIHNAMVVASQTNHDVRIAVGDWHGEAHAQAMELNPEDNQWHFLCFDGHDVHYCLIEWFNIEETYTIDEYLKTRSYYWAKETIIRYD